MSIRQRTPQRTCVACRQVRAKRELIRVVRTLEGNVEIDTTGNKAGRGAYLCRLEECWKVGLRNSRLEHALRTAFSPDNREQLTRFGHNLGQGENHG